MNLTVVARLNQELVTMQYRALSLLALSATTALAAYEGNLNYRSPSLSHPDLGISVPKVVKRSNPAASFDPSQLNFTHGVASGDPYANSVILWTRCSPTLDDVKDDSVVKGSSPLYNPVPIHRSGGEYTPISQAPVCVEYKVGKDKALKQVVNKGKVYTGSDVDYTVKVSDVVDGLQ